jgi:hypothetical protein
MSGKKTLDQYNTEIKSTVGRIRSHLTAAKNAKRQEKKGSSFGNFDMLYRESIKHFQKFDSLISERNADYGDQPDGLELNRLLCEFSDEIEKLKK